MRQLLKHAIRSQRRDAVYGLPTTSLATLNSPFAASLYASPVGRGAKTTVQWYISLLPDVEQGQFNEPKIQGLHALQDQ